MIQDRTDAKPIRHTVRVDEYLAPRTPEDGEPDATRLVVQWQEGDGAIVTDPTRIAELEANLAGQETDHGKR